jgi:hypothetical protein
MNSNPARALTQMEGNARAEFSTGRVGGPSSSQNPR